MENVIEIINVDNVVKPKRRYQYWKPSKHQKLTDDLTPYQRRKFKRILADRALKAARRRERRRIKGISFFSIYSKAIFSSDLILFRMVLFSFLFDEDLVGSFLIDFFEERAFFLSCFFFDLSDLEFFDYPSNLCCFRFFEIYKSVKFFNLFSPSFFLIPPRRPVFFFFNVFFWQSFMTFFILGRNLDPIISAKYNEYLSHCVYFSIDVRYTLSRKFKHFYPFDCNRIFPRKCFPNLRRTIGLWFSFNVHFNKFIFLFRGFFTKYPVTEVVKRLYNWRYRNYISRPHKSSLRRGNIELRIFSYSYDMISRSEKYQIFFFYNRKKYMPLFVSFFSNYFIKFVLKFLSYKKRPYGLLKKTIFKKVFRSLRFSLIQIFLFYLVAYYPKHFSNPRTNKIKILYFLCSFSMVNDMLSFLAAFLNSDLLKRFYTEFTTIFSFFFRILYFSLNNFFVLENFFLYSFLKFPKVDFFDVFFKHSFMNLYLNYFYSCLNVNASSYGSTSLYFSNFLRFAAFGFHRYSFAWFFSTPRLIYLFPNLFINCYSKAFLMRFFFDASFHFFSSPILIYPFTLLQSFFWNIFNFDIQINFFNYVGNIYSFCDNVFIDSIFLYRYNLFLAYSNFVFRSPFSSFKFPSFPKHLYKKVYPFNFNIPKGFSKFPRSKRFLWYKKLSKFNIAWQRHNFMIKSFNWLKNSELFKARWKSNFKFFSRLSLGSQNDIFSITSFLDLLVYSFSKSFRFLLVILSMIFFFDNFLIEDISSPVKSTPFGCYWYRFHLENLLWDWYLGTIWNLKMNIWFQSLKDYRVFLSVSKEIVIFA